MTAINRVVLAGNLTRDPQLRRLESGTTVADLGVASNEVRTNREGERVERACFVDVVAWGKQAESCGQYLKRGACVLIEGSLQLDQWETEDGQKRNRLRVRADRVHFLGRPAGRSGDAGAQEDAPGDVEDERPAEARVRVAEAKRGKPAARA